MFLNFLPNVKVPNYTRILSDLYVHLQAAFLISVLYCTLNCIDFFLSKV